MGWNGSDGSMPKPIKKAKALSASRGLLAGLVVVALACVGLFFVLSGDKKETPAQKNENKQGTIKEVKPAPAAPQTNAVAPEVKKPEKKKHPGFGKTPVEVDENGDRWVVRNGRRRKVIRGGPVGTSRQLWFNKSENVISALVTVKPGDPIVGFDLDGIKKSFAESLGNKIEITDEDTPEEREEKQLVIEAKKTLVKLIKEGGDLEEILREEYGNVMRMYNYRNDLVRELDTIRKNGASAKEMADFVEAANKMLKDRGIENPVRLRPTEIFKLKHENSKE